MRIGKSFWLSCLLILFVSASFVETGVSESSSKVEIREDSIVLKRIGPKRRFGGFPNGVLYSQANQSPKTVVIFIHPESDRRNDWHCMPLAKRGFAAFGFATRYVKEDRHLIMEEVLLDLAEAIRFLKKERGFSHVVLQGHSGGGGVVAYYQNQAEKRAPHRISHTPAGDPPNLNEYNLPPVDGLIISAAHVGRGYAVSRKIDPSVVDEEDPLSVDPTLDPFNPENGFRLAPQSSQFSEDFIKRFNIAQKARMNRLIAKAREMVAERKMYQQLLEAPGFKDRSLKEQLRIQRGAVLQRYMTIYRNFANLYYLDLSIDPNDRVLGGLGDYRPDLRNYYAHFHPRNIIPEAFLSAESLASNVFTPKLLPEVTVPLLVILGSADPSARIGESQAHYDSSGSKDKQFVLIEGADHGYLPAGPKAGKGDQREQTIEVLSNWLEKRFPR